MVHKPNEVSAGRSVEMIEKIAKSRGLRFMETTTKPEGQYIHELTRRLPPRPQAGEDSAQGSPPDYLTRAAQHIAKRDGNPVERAYAVVGRERSDLAKRYRAGTT